MRGRPRGRTGGPVNLYLPDTVRQRATRAAFERGESLSQLVAGLLAREFPPPAETTPTPPAAAGR
jgi:predicted HicB family RNase H-like nuclease